MSELRLTVNGDPVRVGAGCTVADVVQRTLGEAEPKGVAVAVDRSVIPRSEWARTLVQAGAHIEVVTAAAGG